MWNISISFPVQRDMVVALEKGAARERLAFYIRIVWNSFVQFIRQQITATALDPVFHSSDSLVYKNCLLNSEEEEEEKKRCIVSLVAKILK